MKWGKGKGNKRQETNHIKSSKKYEYAAISSYERWEIQEKKRKWNQSKRKTLQSIDLENLSKVCWKFQGPHAFGKG